MLTSFDQFLRLLISAAKPSSKSSRPASPYNVHALQVSITTLFSLVSAHSPLSPWRIRPQSHLRDHSAPTSDLNALLLSLIVNANARWPQEPQQSPDCLDLCLDFLWLTQTISICTPTYGGFLYVTTSYQHLADKTFPPPGISWELGQEEEKTKMQV